MRRYSDVLRGQDQVHLSKTVQRKPRERLCPYERKWLIKACQWQPGRSPCRCTHGKKPIEENYELGSVQKPKKGGPAFNLRARERSAQKASHYHEVISFRKDNHHVAFVDIYVRTSRLEVPTAREIKACRRRLLDDPFVSLRPASEVDHRSLKVLKASSKSSGDRSTAHS